MLYHTKLLEALTVKHGSRLRTLAVQRQHLLLQGTAATITWLMTHLSSSQRCTTLKQVMHPSHARAPGRRPLCFLHPPLNCFSGLLFIHNPCAARQAAHSDMLPLVPAAAAGEVKIFAEVHPDSVCESVATCSFLAPKGSKDALNVKVEHHARVHVAA